MAKAKKAGATQRPIHVGLLGIGTVGGGTWEVLKRNAGEIERRAGRPIRIVAVADKRVAFAKNLVKGKEIGRAHV